MSGRDNPRSLDRPPALRPGDRVAVLTASSPVPAESLERGLTRLRAAGLEPVVFESARAPGSMRPFLAGDDDLRAGDLVAALRDPTIAGILFARGGSGAGRTIAAIDWGALRDVPAKVLAGYSDVTAVLEAVATQLGWASVHGAVVASDAPDTEFSVATLLDVLMTPHEAQICAFDTGTVAEAGRATGLTLGGNLSVLVASLGTPTSRPARDGLLLLEELEEDPYRLDRMLTHLHRAGYLDGVAGIVCGRFHECGPPELVDDILREQLGRLGVPMVMGVDVGHVGANRAFPLGVAATLDTADRTVTFLEPPLRA